MESIEIQNFLTIKKTSISLKKINVFIGPQAQGKSIFAKLIYFMKEIPQELIKTVVEGNTKRVFSSLMKAKFEEMFPKYSWQNQDFNINYKNSHYYVQIQNANGKFSITFSDDIGKSIRHGRAIIKKSDVNEINGQTLLGSHFKLTESVRQTIVGCLFKTSEDRKIEVITYIPAGRSFFANLKENVFSFLSSNIKIDYFLTEFGSFYEQTKATRFYTSSGLTKSTPPAVQKIVEQLICGKHIREKGQDWISSIHGKVNVANSSSGQQESLPMALMLSVWPYVTSSQAYRSFIIEEPEAHLFPEAQGLVVSLIANAYNVHEKHSSYTITTHSPYILTAINNLIQAHNTIKACSYKESVIKAVSDIIPKNEHISFDDVCAYMVNNGEATDILNYEMQLIDANKIDDISNKFAEKFGMLLDLEIENIDNQ